MGPETLLLIGAGVLGLYFWKQKEAAGHLIFFPGNITGMQFVNSTPVVSLTLQVQNTSNVDLHLNSIAGNVLANGQLIGNVSNFTPVIIARNSQTLLPLTAQLQPLGIVNDIIRSFQTGSFAQDISIQGQANVGGVQVDVLLNFKVA